jgi:hypothetical protein
MKKTPAWIKSTNAWKEDQEQPENRWRTVNFLIASERIAAGRSLTEPGTYEELLAFLEYIKRTAPEGHKVIIVDCSEIHQPTVRWRPLDFLYKEGVSISEEHDLAAIASKLWSRLSDSLEKCEFDYWPPKYYTLDGEDLASEIAVQANGC